MYKFFTAKVIRNSVHIAISNSVRDDVWDSIGNIVTNSISNSVHNVVQNLAWNSTRNFNSINTGRHIQNSIYSEINEYQFDNQ